MQTNQRLHCISETLIGGGVLVGGGVVGSIAKLGFLIAEIKSLPPLIFHHDSFIGANTKF